jgi:hypothetical protein
MAAEEPKLIIDTDWKSQAQAEKERLAQKTAAKPATPAGPTSAPGAEGVPEGQEARFEELVGLLATQAMSYLGYFADPQTGQAVVSLEYAKLYIDMLMILEAKTKGNLTEQEQKFLEKSLSQIRMDFVEVSKAVAKAVQEGRIKPAPAQGSGGIVGPGMAGAGAPPGPKTPGKPS